MDRSTTIRPCVMNLRSRIPRSRAYARTPNRKPELPYSGDCIILAAASAFRARRPRPDHHGRRNMERRGLRPWPRGYGAGHNIPDPQGSRGHCRASAAAKPSSSAAMRSTVASRPTPATRQGHDGDVRPCTRNTPGVPSRWWPLKEAYRTLVRCTPKSGPGAGASWRPRRGTGDAGRLRRAITRVSGGDVSAPWNKPSPKWGPTRNCSASERSRLCTFPRPEAGWSRRAGPREASSPLPSGGRGTTRANGEEA